LLHIFHCLSWYNEVVATSNGGMTVSNIDQQFVEYIVKSLVGKPEAVEIRRRIDEKGVLLELSVDPEDLGRVIGKRGATAQSLRTLLRALGTKNDARYNLKIVDPAEGEGFTATPNDVSDNTQVTGSATDDAVQSDSEDDTEESEMASKTRRELAELDDLDV
jgi:uncharacterized protein